MKQSTLTAFVQELSKKEEMKEIVEAM